MIISPSILASDFLNLETELKRFDGMSNVWLHLDIMDGHFVPNLTFGHPVVELIAKKTRIPLDAHFMVTNPEFYIDTFKNYEIYNFTFHYELFEGNHSELISLLKKAKLHYKSVGLSIKPNTPVNVLSLDILSNLDLVLVMSVEPGFGGQKFMPNSLDKIAYLNVLRKEKKLNFQIQVDGGINQETAEQVREKGADNLVAGSYVFNFPHHKTKNAIESLI